MRADRWPVVSKEDSHRFCLVGDLAILRVAPLEDQARSSTRTGAQSDPRFTAFRASLARGPVGQLDRTV
jgi:hypothetical protein